VKAINSELRMQNAETSVSRICILHSEFCILNSAF
jgi:hypothetical protein